MQLRLGHVREAKNIFGAEKMNTMRTVSEAFPRPDVRLLQFVVETKPKSDSYAIPSSTPASFPSKPEHRSPPESLNRTSTRISGKISGFQPYSSSVFDQDKELRLRLAAETAGLFVGPMPCQEFLDTFLPHPSNAELCPATCAKIFDKVPAGVREPDMYKPFVDAMGQKYTPDLRLVITSSAPDLQCDSLKPDIGVYREDREEGPVTDFSRMEFWIEFKFRKDFDGFRDPLSPGNPDHLFEHDSENSQLTRGQIASYAAAHMGTQFRVHAFALLICSSFARFIRWDRAAATVSQEFDYTKQPALLTDFFWRYSHLDFPSRGYDTSVSTPESWEIGCAKTHLLVKNPGPPKHTFVKLMVPSRNDANHPGYYIALSPKYSSRSPFGRATRPTRAYDLASDSIVFLKDYWRIDAPGMEKEGDIYTELKRYNVPHIAPFDRGDDVPGHTTVTQTLIGKPWAYSTKQISRYQHYRMTLKLVGRDITSFKISREFVKAIADAMEAHQHAYEKAGILHRDISAGNIVITDEGEGILIDWDLSVHIHGSKSTPRRPGRTGTWQFISAALLADPGKFHELKDDRESALHLLTWIALRYTKHNKSPRELYRLMGMFDEVFISDQGASGGLTKQGHLTSSQIPKEVSFDCGPLNSLIKQLTKAFAVRYEAAPTPEDFSADLSSPFFTETVHHYDARMKALEEPTWLVNIFRRHLARSDWPDNDEASPQAVDSGRANASHRKRNSDQLKLESNVPRQGKLPKVHGSDHNMDTT